MRSGCAGTATGSTRVAVSAAATVACAAGRGARRLGLGRGGGAFARGFDHRDHAAFRQLVADLDLEFAHHAGERRRHFHRRLVRFQRDQALVGLHRVADGDQQFDHRHVVVSADIGDACFLHLSHGGSASAKAPIVAVGGRSANRRRSRFAALFSYSWHGPSLRMPALWRLAQNRPRIDSSGLSADRQFACAPNEPSVRRRSLRPALLPLADRHDVAGAGSGPRAMPSDHRRRSAQRPGAPLWATTAHPSEAAAAQSEWGFHKAFLRPG